MAFAKKCLDFDITLQSGNFQGGGNNAHVKGHRASVRIQQAGPPDQGTAEIAIFGLPLSLMNQLTITGTNMEAVGKNFITVRAYEEGQTPAIAFKGTIMAAYTDARQQPQVSFRISALGGLYEAVAPAQPTSVQGSADVAQTIEGMAKQVGWQFENNGVNVKLNNPYYYGGVRGQIRQIAQDARINWVYDVGTCAIWPRNGSRMGDVPEIAPGRGLVGYPTFNQSGIEVTCEYNPNLRYGGRVKVQSQLTPACGVWYIYGMSHALDAETPGGQWFTMLSTSKIQT